MLKKFLILFIFFMLVNTSFAEDVTQQCRDTQFQRAGEPLPVKIVDSCGGALGGAVANMIDQGVSGKKDINWGNVAYATVGGAIAGFVNPIETIGLIAPTVIGGLIDGAVGTLYDNYKDDK